VKKLRRFLLLSLIALLSVSTVTAFHVPPWDTGHNSFQGDPGDDDTDPGDDCPCKSGSPVELASGNFVYSSRDLRITGLGPAIELVRTYNSRDMRKGPFGNGWVYSYDQRIVETTDEVNVYAIYSNPDGKRDVFTKLPDGSYQPPPQVRASLVKNSDHTYILKENTGLVRRFDQDGRLITITDRNGNSLSLTYDATGFPTAMTDATGRTAHFTKGADGRFESMTDPANNTYRYLYDAAGNLIRFTDPLGNSTNYQYDSKSNLLAVIDARGNRQVGATYDSKNRVGILFEGAEAWTYNYQPTSSRTTKTNLAGRTWTFDYNSFGSVTKRTDPLGKSELYVFDGNLNITQLTDKNGNKTTYTYDANSNTLTVTDALGNVRTFTYEQTFNLPLSDRDPLGNLTRFEYDSHGNLLKRVNPSGDFTQFQYDSKGQLVKEIDAVGGNTTYTYDANGNLIKTINPLGDSDTATYDILNRRVSRTDQEGRTTQFEYDKNDRLVKVTDAQGGVTINDYDAADNLIAITLANGKRTTYEYDSFNRLTRSLNPLGQSTVYTYNRQNTLASKTTPLGQQINYTYDVIDRLIAENRPDGVVAYTYDNVGNTLTIINNDSRLTFSYDVLNRVSEARTAATSHQPLTTIRYTYDSAGRRKTMTDTTGGVTAYSYDARSLITSIVDPSGMKADFEYDKLQRRTRMSRAGGPTTQYSYDAANRLLSIAHQSSAGNLAFNYLHDRSGNRLTIADTNGTHSYSYDLLSQLTAATHPQGFQPHEAYAYDPVGNRVSSHLSSASTYNEANRLLADAQFDYTYDADGRMTRKVERANGSLTSFTYDSEGQLLRIDFPDSTFVSYNYDGLGRRIEKNVNGQVTRFVYDAWDILAEYSAAGNVTTGYTHGPEVDEILAMRQNATTSFFEVDAQRSVVRIASGGSASVSYNYDSFGRVTSQTGTATAPFAFQGRELDAESGLYYFRARYYDPRTGRFLSEDPLRFSGGDNFYTFVANNPVNLLDPSGLSPSFGDCLGRCALDQYGLGSLLGAGGVGAGLPLLEKRFVTPGSSSGTSIASKYLSRWLPQRLPFRVLAPTLERPLAVSPILGRVLGRWVPIVGWGLLAYDVGSIAACVEQCMKEDTCTVNTGGK
jgi:RHS repeat-associated protein